MAKNSNRKGNIKGKKNPPATFGIFTEFLSMTMNGTVA